MGSFMLLDKLNPNGQVDWDEWLQSYVEKVDQTQQKTRAFKESMAFAKAAWREAARSNPDKLNIDEYLSFTHSEFSHPLILISAEELIAALDENRDGKLSLEEYVKRAEDLEAEVRRQTFKLCDSDSDGFLSRNELLATYCGSPSTGLAQGHAGIGHMLVFRPQCLMAPTCHGS